MIVFLILYVAKHNDKCLKENSEFSYLVGKYKNTHIFEATLVLIAPVKMAEMMHGEQWGDKVHLSANTVVRWTKELKSC